MGASHRSEAGSRGLASLIRPEPARPLGRDAVALIAILWIMQFVLTTIRENLPTGNAPGFDGGVRRLIVHGCGAVLFYLAAQLLDRLRNRSFTFRAGFALPLALVGAVTQALLGRLIFYYVLPMDGLPFSEAWDVSRLFTSIQNWLWSYFAWSAIYLALSYNRDVNARDRRLSAVEALAQQAQLRALRYQVNPHFLFNTLNAISALVMTGHNRRAEAMLADLADFMRAALRMDPVDDVTVEAEFEHEKLYLQIEQTRFPERLAVRFELSPEVRNAMVPGLILQPLIENAVKHAVAPASRLVNVHIVARRDGATLTIEVSDDGDGAASGEPGAGVGLTNVGERLAAKFGDTATFDAGQTADGFLARLALPLRYARQ